MQSSAGRSTYATYQAYNWARVAGGLKIALKEREAARQRSNREPDSVSEWQRWLLDHLDAEGIDVQQAIGLAEMWVRVAGVQSQADDAIPGP
ncbi:hypothetical protein [Streptomyces sp. NPDC018693]|uniref:hypothetical protein n=1 Tax=unclassified Streptomyces TaxID=2593676 RepID=UPI0037B2091F